MPKANIKTDLLAMKDYLNSLSLLAENLSESIVVPKRTKKDSIEMYEAIVSQAVKIAEDFEEMELLLRKSNMIIVIKE